MKIRYGLAFVFFVMALLIGCRSFGGVINVQDFPSASAAVVADAAARKAIAPASVGMKVVQTDENVDGYPTVLYTLTQTNAALDSSWMATILLNPETGVAPIDFRLADFTGIIPNSNAIGQVDGELRIGDGETEGGLIRGASGEIVVNFKHQIQKQGILNPHTVRAHYEFRIQCVPVVNSEWDYLLSIYDGQANYPFLEINPGFDLESISAAEMAVRLKSSILSAVEIAGIPPSCIDVRQDPGDPTVLQLFVGGRFSKYQLQCSTDDLNIGGVITQIVTSILHQEQSGWMPGDYFIP